MDIHIGYEISFECVQPTPMMVMLNVHPSRAGDLKVPDTLMTTPNVPSTRYRDRFDNWCTRFVAPVGRTTLTADGVIWDSGEADFVVPGAAQTPVQDLPEDVLIFLLGSRYCETDRLSEIAWGLFGGVPAGWARVQAIVDFVHGHLAFNYANARSTRTAWDAFNERTGVCRDFAHLAITLCRCMNIPARYCTGYLGDIGIAPLPDPMDFSAWFEAYLDGCWYSFDARHRVPRIGRIVIGYGRDATDVAISTSFGSALLSGFRVWTEEIPENRLRRAVAAG